MAHVIPRKPVYSTDLKTVGYDDRLQILDVEFLKTGHVYRAEGVPATLYREMMVAPSIGGYYHKHLKNNFKFTKI